MRSMITCKYVDTTDGVSISKRSFGILKVRNRSSLNLRWDTFINLRKTIYYYKLIYVSYM